MDEADEIKKKYEFILKQAEAPAEEKPRLLKYIADNYYSIERQIKWQKKT